MRGRRQEHGVEPRSDTELGADLLAKLMRSRGPIQRAEALRTLSHFIDPRVDPDDNLAEERLRRVVASLPSEAHKAGEILLVEAHKYVGYTLRYRQALAAEAFGVSWETFRKRYQREFFNAIAALLIEGSEPTKFKSTKSSQTSAEVANPRLVLAPNSYFPHVRTLPGDVDAGYGGLTEALKTLDRVELAVVLAGDLLLVKLRTRLVAKTLTRRQVRELRTKRIECLADAEKALEFILEPDMR